MAESKPSIVPGSYGGLGSLVLRAGDLQAVVLPQLGAQIVSLRDLRRDLRFLREPPVEADMASYRAHPVPYGIPLLYPPNRIADGTFRFAGTTYRLPINEPALHNHLHGLFYGLAWRPVEQVCGAASARVVLRRAVTAGDPVFRLFAHECTLDLAYELSAEGLRHRVQVRNDGDRLMPLMIGLHTTFQVPFGRAGTPADCRVSVNIGERWELTAQKVPSGRRLPLDAMERSIAAEGGDPFAHPIDALYSNTGAACNRCQLVDPGAGVRLLYETDRRFRTWMLWNGDARSGFFAAEPMTCLVNAPNLALPPEVTGMLALQPGATWSAESRLRPQSWAASP